MENESKANILMVDDNPDNLVALRAVLGELGGQLHTATSGKQALRMLLDEEYALVLLDVNMPIMDGFETASLMKQVERLRDIPIIFITSMSQDEEHLLRGYATGAVDYIFTPVIPNVLRAKVSAFIQLHKLNRKAQRHAQELLQLNQQLAGEIAQHQLAKAALQASEANLREKNLELERAQLAKDRFFATMSHELRTPLNAIIGFTSMLLMKLPGPLTHDQERQLELVKSAGQHLLAIISDVLDLAKVESGKIELRIEPLCLSELVSEVAEMLGPLAEKKGLHFEVQCPAAKIDTRGDRRFVRQILLNLAGNAVKFTARCLVSFNLCSRESNGQTFAAIEVADTGPGIAPDEQEKIFGEYMQAKAGHNTESTGLGLYLSQKLAHLMQGRIEFESEGGKGSIFRLLLPASQGENSEACAHYNL